jgi:tryptophanyl-tRNA synthetase
LACGIDPRVSTIFIQSHVAAHAEGCWLLNCITPLGWLQRMTQFKDKSARQESVLTGLLDYPVLMAGDIIFYDADEVPVGEDQKQHVELARDIAQRFNALYGADFFIIPQPVIPRVGARVMGLDDPLVKMSKSLADKRGHAVRMLDEPDEVMYAFKRAVTDSGREIRFSEDTEKAGVNNLLGIYQAVTGKGSAAVEADFAGARGYGDLKMGVAEVVIEMLRPIQARYKELMGDTAELDRLLAYGAEQARAVSQPKVDEMKRMMGLVVPG